MTTKGQIWGCVLLAQERKASSDKSDSNQIPRILPTIHSQTPFDEANFDSILSYLDHIIIELSQAVTDNNDPDTAAVVNESAAESMSEEEQIRGFVRDSC